MTEPDETAGGEPLIADIMVTDVVTARPDMSVKELAELLRERGVGGVPVVDDDGAIIGMVTDGDLMALDADLHFPHYIQFLDSVIYLERASKFEERLKKAVAATVRDIMTDEVLTVRPDDPVRKAATLMSEHKIDRVPVEQDGALVGIVGRHDVLKVLGL
jgi:CBS domain-containing protein